MKKRSSSDQKTQDNVAVRLEGGIGDHILGLRLLPFVRAAYPNSKIILYSDAGSNEVQRDLVRMSVLADSVQMIRRTPGSVSLENMGQLEVLVEEDRRSLNRSAYFFDAWGGNYFLDASLALNVPVFEILATRPELRVPQTARRWAQRKLAGHTGCKFIAMNLTKYGPDFIPFELETVHKILAMASERTDIRLLNLYSKRFRYPHWPDDVQRLRVETQLQESELLDQVSLTDDRILSLVDLEISRIAALLQRCCYFIGVDNGIRHLAWALGVHSTVLMPERPDPHFALRWCHDYHRVITPRDPVANIEQHARTLNELVAAKHEN